MYWNIRAATAAACGAAAEVPKNDENPETVSLPVGSYTVVARSQKDGYVRVPVMIKDGRRTILALDL